MRELEKATPGPLIKDGAEVYLIKEGAFGDGPGLVIPALLALGGQVRTVLIDAVGKAHPTEEYMNKAEYTVVPASKW